MKKNNDKFNDIKDIEEITFLKAKDVAELLQIGKNKAYSLMRSESFPAIKIQHDYRVSVKDLREWCKTYCGKTFYLE